MSTSSKRKALKQISGSKYLQMADYVEKAVKKDPSMTYFKLMPELEKKFNVKLTYEGLKCGMRRIGIRRTPQSAALDKRVMLPAKNSTPVDVANLLTENRLLHSKLAKEEQRTQALLTTVQSSIATLKPVKVLNWPVPKGQSHQPEEFVALWSDFQIGQKVEPAETVGLEKYNFDIFCDRVDELYKGIYKVWDIHKSVRRIPRLNICMLGDMVEGENIFKGQGFFIDKPLVDQLFDGAIKVATTIRSLAPLFPRIDIFCVIGNHGRAGRPNEFHHLTNWDYVFYNIIAGLLKAQTNVHLYISTSPVMGVQILNTSLLLMHGDEVPVWLGFPMYGIDRAVKSYTIALHKVFDIVCCGHFHTKADMDVSAMEIITNGALPGGSYYSMKRLKTRSIPKQVLFGIHPEIGKSFQYDLKLAKPTELAKITKNQPICTPYIKGRLNDQM